MTAPTVVILAAGKGSRMRSALPKVLHPLCGRPLVEWPIHAAREAGAARIVVVDSAARPLDGHLPADVVLAVQERPNGTADAVEAAVGAFPADGAVVVLSGDVPLVTADFVRDLVAAHAASGAAATMATISSTSRASTAASCATRPAAWSGSSRPKAAATRPSRSWRSAR
jgi:bifunctional UDP-N-acetylglucosamine pyrophosphorylase / glucosamine-1-phosphate N-acetyltransferase